MQTTVPQVIRDAFSPVWAAFRITADDVEFSSNCYEDYTSVQLSVKFRYNDQNFYWFDPEPDDDQCEAPNGVVFQDLRGDRVRFDLNGVVIEGCASSDDEEEWIQVWLWYKLTEEQEHMADIQAWVDELDDWPVPVTFVTAGPPTRASTRMQTEGRY